MKITVENVCKSFGRKSVLENLSFSLESGKCIGILGENGAGKSTLFGVLTGLQKGEGSFLCDGVDFMQNPKKRTEMVGFVPQSPPLLNELSAKDNLRLWYSSDTLRAELRYGTLAMLGIPEFLNVPVSKMSGGMKKRLAIGCAVANNPKILFLDEPSSALDLVCKARIYDYLRTFKEQGGAIILATHDAYELDFCDEIYVLKRGKLRRYDGERRVELLIGQLTDE